MSRVQPTCAFHWLFVRQSRSRASSAPAPAQDSLDMAGGLRNTIQDKSLFSIGYLVIPLGSTTFG
jgi:hypothetical protein